MNYMGSKIKIVKDILPYIQQCIDDNNVDNYIEPFCGGANVIDKVSCCHKTGIDSNKYLIALLNHVKNGGKLHDDITKDFYYQIWQEYKNPNTTIDNWIIGEVGFLASYNSRFFKGYGCHTKPDSNGRVRDRYKERVNSLTRQIPQLKDICFVHENFFNLPFRTNTFIYCDPPYKNTQKYSNSKNFNYDLFWDKIREFSFDNFVIVSEQSAPDDFICVWEKKVNRTMMYGSSKSVTEKLFTYNKGKYIDWYRKKCDNIET